MTVTRLFILTLTLAFSLTSIGQSSNPVGDAYSEGDNCFSITGDVLWQLGAVWFNDPVDLTEELEIELLINFGASDAGADGVVFVFQQEGVNALGIPGGGLGFEGFSPSLGIEMDTYQNIDLGDIANDHMALVANGLTNHNLSSNLVGPLNIRSDAANVEDNQYHPFKLTWDPETTTLEIYFDCELRISHQIDITNEIFFGETTVYWGFTGATGGLSNNQSVCINEYALGLPEELFICEGESIELGISGSGNGSLEWFPAAGLDDPTSPTPIASPDQTTTYTVTYTDLCNQQTSLSTTINVTSISADLPEEVFFCEGESSTVTIDTSAPDILWSNGDTGSTTEITSEGEFSAVLSELNCEVTVYSEMFFLPVPAPLAWQDSFSVCAGETVSLDATSEPGTSYSWSNGEIDAQIEVETSDTYEVEITNADGCISVFSAEVEIIDYPVYEPASEITICSDSSIELDAGTADQFEWMDGSTSQILEVQESGLYTVVMSNGDCETQGETDVVLFSLPSFEWPEEIEICNAIPFYQPLPSSDLAWSVNGISVSDSVLISGSEVNLTGSDSVTNCFDVMSAAVTEIFVPEIFLAPQAVLCDGYPVDVLAHSDYEQNMTWDDGTEGNEITFSSPGVYSVDTYNQCGAVSDSILVFEGLCSCPLYVPNSFSPNDDGRNDLFIPSIDCDVESYTFRIFNRWGEEIFSTIDPNTGWYGAAAGNEHYAIDGVYVWQVTYQVNLQRGVELVNETGMVELFR